MKKFKYRMEALLKMKEHVEKEKQKILAISQKKIYDQEHQLDKISTTSGKVNESQLLKTKKPFTVAEMLVYSRYIHKLKRERLVGEQMLNVLKLDEDKKRRELLKASKEKKKYAKLREKQQDAYYQNIDKSNAKENDEIASTNFRFKKKK